MIDGAWAIFLPLVSVSAIAGNHKAADSFGSSYNHTPTMWSAYRVQLVAAFHSSTSEAGTRISQSGRSDPRTFVDKSVGIDDSYVKSKQITSLQKSNAYRSILTNPLGNVTVDNELQLKNANAPMDSTLLGIVMSKSASQS